MSTNKDDKIKEILQRLKFAKKFDTWEEVAGYLGERGATISAWKTRGSPSALEKILYRCRDDINESYLLTGQGPMFGVSGSMVGTLPGLGGTIEASSEPERRAVPFIGRRGTDNLSPQLKKIVEDLQGIESLDPGRLLDVAIHIREEWKKAEEVKKISRQANS